MISVLYEEITRMAYDIYEQNGREDGNDLNHWLEAERLVFRRCLLCGVMMNEVTALLEYQPARMTVKSPSRPTIKKPAASSTTKIKMKNKTRVNKKK
jgi:hypothetical protein